MKPYFGEDRPDDYWWFVKGTEGWTGITIVVLMAIAYTLAQPWFRRNRLNLPKPLKKLTGFNAFWYSHHLFVIVYGLFIVHGYYLYLTKKWYKKTVCTHACTITLKFASYEILLLILSQFISTDLDVYCNSYATIRMRAIASCFQVRLQKCQNFEGTVLIPKNSPSHLKF